MRFFLTVAEVIMYLIFFSAWFGLQNNAVVMSIMIMLPVPLAVTFSGKSYVGELFRATPHKVHKLEIKHD